MRNKVLHPEKEMEKHKNKEQTFSYLRSILLFSSTCNIRNRIMRAII